MKLPLVANWQCAQTGDCCHDGPVVTLEELALLRDVQPLTAEPYGHLWKVVGAPCPFLGDDHRCRVYERRPYNCRRFICLRAPGEPFLPGGEMGCLNLSVRMHQSRDARRDYARSQRKAQRWGRKHGWTEDML